MAITSGKRQHIPQHTYRGRTQRDERIDNVRGILTMLVVIGHFLLPLHEAGTRLILGLIYVIYVFHMPCFVMISGYYAKSVYRDGRFRWGKVVQMLWLYFVYEVIVDITEGLLAGNIPLIPNFFKESGAPWYLLSLASWYMTIPFFQRFRGGKRPAAVLAVMVLAVVFGKYVLHTGSWLSLDRTVSFMPFFYLGYYNSQRSLDRYLISRFKRPVDLAAVFLVLLVLVSTKDWLFKYNLVVYGSDYSRYIPEQHDMLWIINLVWYAAALIISLGLIGLTLNRRMLIMTDLGRNSLQVYFLHRPIRDLLQYFGFYDFIDPYDRLSVLFLVAFSAALTIFLGNGFITEFFDALRSVFDASLEKRGAL